MALIDLQFEDEEEVQPTSPGPIELEFEGQGEGPPLVPGTTGYAAPVERDPFQWIRDTYMEGYTKARQSIAQQKGLMLDKTAEDRARTGARVKELERESERYGMELDTMRQLQQISEADSITDAVGLMVRYPKAVAAVTISSLGRFAPALAATAGTGAATGGATLPLMASTFMGSLAIEYGAVMDEEIRASGYDPSDPTSWQRAVSDPEMLARAKERGLKRGIPIAAFDAISMGVAGKIMAGAKPAATSILPRAGAEMGVQMGTGAAGEAAAQFVETGEVGAPGEVALEGVAELGPGIVETLIGYKGEKAQALRRQMAEQAGAEAAQQEADKALIPDFEIKSLEENATAIDEALAAAPPTPEVPPAEESITEKFDLEQEVEQPQLDITDPEQLQAEQEANKLVFENLRAQFPEASEEELLAAIEAFKPPREELPTEEDLGWKPPEETKAQAVEPKMTPPPEQPQPDDEAPAAPTEAQPWGPVAQPEITRDEVVQATEQVEPTGEAITAAETVRASRPEFDGLILSFKPGDTRNDRETPHYYGELAETEDADGMPIDVVLNAEYDANIDSPVFIVNQMEPETGKFRQHKVMAGFPDARAAEQGYVDMWGPDGFESIHQLTPEQFQEWRQSGNHKVAYNPTAAAQAAAMQELVSPEPAAADISKVSPEDFDAMLEEGGPAEETEQQRKDKLSVERQQRAKKAVEAGRKADPDVDDAVTFIRKLGGLNIEKQSDVPAGRLKHLDEERRQVGLPSIEQTGDKGLSLEQVTEALWEAGYIPDNDSRLAIDLLYEAEQAPQYTAKGQEAATQRAADEEYQRQLDAEAQEWAEFVNTDTEFSQVDPETARLMKLAGDIDHDMMVDIASRDVPEADVQAALQAFIDERKGKETEAARPEEPASEAGRPDEGKQAPAENKWNRKFPRRDVIPFEPITDLTELNVYREEDFSYIDSFLMDQALEQVNRSIKAINDYGYEVNDVWSAIKVNMPVILQEPLREINNAATPLIPLSRKLGAYAKGQKGRSTPEKVLDQLYNYVSRDLKPSPFPDGKGFKEHIQENYPEFARRLDQEAGLEDETGQVDLVGKTEEERSKQKIEDEKKRRAEQVPTERPAEAQSGDDLFANEGQLEPDLFAEPAAEEKEVDEVPADERWRLVDNATVADYPIGSEWYWSGFKAKVTGVRTREETGGRPEVDLEYLEGPLKGEATDAPGHLKALQATLIEPFDVETTMGPVRITVDRSLPLEKFQEIYDDNLVDSLNIEMHGWAFREKLLKPGSGEQELEFRSIAGLPVRAERPEQLNDPEWIKETAIRAVNSVLRKGEYFGEHVGSGKYKGGKAWVIGRPPDTMEEVLELSRDPMPDSKELNKIRITIEDEDTGEKVTHNAKWWVDAFDKRLEKVAKLRTCA